MFVFPNNYFLQKKVRLNLRAAMPAREKRKLKEDSSRASKSAPKASEAKKRKVDKPEVKPAAAKSKSGGSDKALFSRWLMKSEPESRFENGVDMKFGIDDLEASPDQTAPWDGVRNYQVLSLLLLILVYSS